MITQMIEDNGNIASLLSGAKVAGAGGPDGSPRQAPAVSPSPMIPDVTGAPHASGFGGDSLVPVTATPGNSHVRGDMGGSATVSAGGEARVVGEDSLNSGKQPNAMPDETPAVLVGDLVTGSAREGFATQGTPAQLNGDLVTGQSRGGFAPGVNVPTVGTPSKTPSNDRGVA